MRPHSFWVYLKARDLMTSIGRWWIFNDLLSTSLDKLLLNCDPNVKVFNAEQRIFYSMLTWDDYLSSTPLKAAYIWTLSTRSAIVGRLNFYEDVFTIQCSQLAPARLFPGDDSSICDTSFLRQDVLYYADERNGKPIHPLADIFFITDEQQLVLVKEMIIR
jgi:hypothetical protein